ncbi:MAG: type IV conjugative transfer system protein TraL [Gammaproteobacteria bacterium]|nr:type IV conjugative transfer system protein TraL [Gammaproteobacteria bacterium]
MYRMMQHLDEPLRLLGLTMDEVFIVSCGLLLLVTTTHKILAGVFCFGLYILLTFFKKGQNPRFLLVLVYWYLPFELSMFIVRHLPQSHLRVWRG